MSDPLMVDLTGFEGLCYRKLGSSEFLVAAFRYAAEAKTYVERQSFPDHWVIRTVSGDKVRGVTGHGYAILEKLRDA